MQVACLHRVNLFFCFLLNIPSSGNEFGEPCISFESFGRGRLLLSKVATMCDLSGALLGDISIFNQANNPFELYLRVNETKGSQIKISRCR